MEPDKRYGLTNLIQLYVLTQKVVTGRIQIIRENNASSIFSGWYGVWSHTGEDIADKLTSLEGFHNTLMFALEA